MNFYYGLKLYDIFEPPCIHLLLAFVTSLHVTKSTQKNPLNCGWVAGRKREHFLSYKCQLDPLGGRESCTSLSQFCGGTAFRFTFSPSPSNNSFACLKKSLILLYPIPLKQDRMKWNGCPNFKLNVRPTAFPQWLKTSFEANVWVGQACVEWNLTRSADCSQRNLEPLHALHCRWSRFSISTLL